MIFEDGRRLSRHAIAVDGIIIHVIVATNVVHADVAGRARLGPIRSAWRLDVRRSTISSRDSR